MLRCEGNPSCGDMILHRFSKTRACTIRNEGGVMQNGTEELYSCSICGVMRRWGIGAPQSVQHD